MLGIFEVSSVTTLWYSRSKILPISSFWTLSYFSLVLRPFLWWAGSCQSREIHSSLFSRYQIPSWNMQSCDVHLRSYRACVIVYKEYIHLLPTMSILPPSISRFWRRWSASMQTSDAQLRHLMSILEDSLHATQSRARRVAVPHTIIWMVSLLPCL